MTLFYHLFCCGTNVTSTFDTAVLNGWVDEMDRPVYAEAVKINLQRGFEIWRVT
jgi:hypothetical protein